MSKMAPGTVGVTQYASGVTVKAAKRSLSCTHLLWFRSNPLNPATCKILQTAMTGHKHIHQWCSQTWVPTYISELYTTLDIWGWGRILCRLCFINIFVLEAARIGRIGHRSAWLSETACVSESGIMKNVIKLGVKDVFSSMGIMENMYLQDPGVIGMAPAVLYICGACSPKVPKVPPFFFQVSLLEIILMGAFHSSNCFGQD